MAGPDTPRARARAQTMTEILRIAREQLGTHGAAALSLRAVARDLGVVSSAVYRYVASRDELLTLLLIAGYDELGDEVDAAVATVPVTDHRARFLTLGRTVRAWARREPATYGLLYGSPVPGYAAPAERTTGPGTRVAGALVHLLAEACADGVLVVPPDPRDAPAVTTPELSAGFDGVREQFGVAAADLPDAVLSRGVLALSSLFGAVSFEVFGQYGADGLGDPGALFEQHLVYLADLLGLAADRT